MRVHHRGYGRVAVEVLIMGDNRNPFLRTLAEQPGGEDDGGQDRLQVARRQVDDNPPFASLGRWLDFWSRVADRVDFRIALPETGSSVVGACSRPDNRPTR